MNIEKEIEKNLKQIDELGFSKNIILNTKQVARILGVSPSSIENYRRAGIGIDYIKIGERIMYSKRDVAEFLATKKIRTA
ncbi:helix-turn-helix domain-containing protein [Aliarcobacter thereius]|uniref:Helix-turn-helix domain-containing protein n=1 Tax=Aliarcobacter thereius TaxID=544718 RepID=A0A5R9H277_9BACT|nr:helix-turn-helix domain-containing protein [Aliarcobacter thereius]TLS71400.1 helix-turn-helix domain-containing protein [Aliarcobacter thereius]